MPDSRKLFGTDGIRGRYGSYPLDARTLYAIGMALAHQVQASRSPRILIGMDPRESSPEIASLLAAGFDQGGVLWEYAGIVPTPAIAYATRCGDFALGVMVSASHNPFDDNGIKVFGPFGYKLPDATETELERRILSLRENIAPQARALSEPSANIALDYARHLLQASRVPASVRGLRVVVDCANGAASHVAPLALEGLGLDVRYVSREPDGRNINEGCGALHTELLAKEVIASGGHFGAALDGDADRCLLVDENGELLNGDNLLLLAAASLQDRDLLRDRQVVATVMSNLGLEIALRDRGVRLIRTPVGDRHVIREMLRCSATLGGEQSGHVIFGDHTTTGDGLLTMLMMLGIVAEAAVPCSELRKRLQVYPQQLINVRVSEKRPLRDLPEIQQAVLDRELELAGRGRILVRYSGTEPVARIMVEAEDNREVLRHGTAIADLFEKHLGQ